MPSNLDLLYNVVDIEPILIRLANGSMTHAINRGLVTLNANMIPYDVLYLPSLDCNLISITQLLNEICCMVTFTKKHCVVQDLTSKKSIGVAEPRRGVFICKEESEASIQANEVASHDL